MALNKLNHVILPEDEIRELIKRHRAGDEQAAEIIIAHNERAIFRVAIRYHSTGVCGDVPIEDLMQMGRIGICALQDFDLASGTKFLTYAWAWIRMYISRYGEKEGQQVKLSYRASNQRAKIGTVRAEFVQKNGKEPTRQELSEITGVHVDQVARLSLKVRSLDAVHDSKKTSLGDTIASPDDDPAEKTEEKILLEIIKKRVSLLPARWKKILTMHYGLNGKEPKTLNEIADHLGLTRERVRQIRNDALARIKEDL